jgi:hypothetical protein
MAKVRKTLAVCKQRSHRFSMERFSLKMLNKIEDKQQYQVEVSNIFTFLEDLDT